MGLHDMARTNDTRMTRAAKLAAMRARMIARVYELQVEIGRLTPIGKITDLLKAGIVSSEWFVQRLIDSGLSLEHALNEFNLLRHGADGEKIEQLKEHSIQAKPSPYFQPIKSPARYSKKPPSLSTPAEGCIGCKKHVAAGRGRIGDSDSELS